MANISELEVLSKLKLTKNEKIKFEKDLFFFDNQINEMKKFTGELNSNNFFNIKNVMPSINGTLREDIHLEEKLIDPSINSNNFNDGYFKLNFNNEKKFKTSINIDENNSVLNRLNGKNDNKGKLSNLKFAIKDNFAIKDEVTSSATGSLRNFRPNYSSTVFEKLINNGAIPLYKSNLDELAMGGTGLESFYGEVHNPLNDSLMIGGSSSGSNYLISKKLVDFAIGSDTGDSVRRPAALTGVYGFKPSYGIVSRYGMYNFSSSLDTVAWFTKNLNTSKLLLDILNGFDKNDSSSININLKQKEVKKLIIFKNIEKYILEEDLKINYLNFIKKFKEKFNVVEIEINEDLLKLVSISYKIISSSESFSNNSNLTGFLFGEDFIGKNFNDSIIESRTKNFGYEVKKRFLLAKYVELNNLLKYANNIRNQIFDYLNEIFDEDNLIIVPATSRINYKINNSYDYEWNNILSNILTLFNFSLSPSLTLPIKYDNKFLPINISGKFGKDLNVFSFAKIIEGVFNE